MAYTITTAPNGTQTVTINEDELFPVITKSKYSILRGHDGKLYIQTAEFFGYITDIGESSKLVPAVSFKTIPDERSGLLLGDKIVVG